MNMNWKWIRDEFLPSVAAVIMGVGMILGLLACVAALFDPRYNENDSGFGARCVQMSEWTGDTSYLDRVDAWESTSSEDD